MPDIVTFSDIQSYWEDLRPKSVEVRVTKQPVEEDLEAVSKETAEALTRALKERFTGADLNNVETLVSILTLTMQTFMARWYEHQKHYDLGYLMEVILESQKDMPLNDIKGFIRALPLTILSRLLNQSKGQMTGLHALLALEEKRRNRELNDYDIRFDPDHRLVVSFSPPDHRVRAGEALTFALRDIFTGR